MKKEIERQKESIAIKKKRGEEIFEGDKEKKGEPLSASFACDPTREKTEKYGWFFVFYYWLAALSFYGWFFAFSYWLAMLFVVDADPLFGNFKPLYFSGVGLLALGGFFWDLKIWAVWAIQGLLLCGFFLGGGLRWPVSVMQFSVGGLWVCLAFYANMKWVCLAFSRNMHERKNRKVKRNLRHPEIDRK